MDALLFSLPHGTTPASAYNLFVTAGKFASSADQTLPSAILRIIHAQPLNAKVDVFVPTGAGDTELSSSILDILTADAPTFWSAPKCDLSVLLNDSNFIKAINSTSPLCGISVGRRVDLDTVVAFLPKTHTTSPQMILNMQRDEYSMFGFDDSNDYTKRKNHALPAHQKQGAPRIVAIDVSPKSEGGKFTEGTNYHGRVIQRLKEATAPVNLIFCAATTEPTPSANVNFPSSSVTTKRLRCSRAVRRLKKLAVPKVNFDSFVMGAYPKSGAKGGDAVTQEETIWTWLGAIFTGVDEYVRGEDSDIFASSFNLDTAIDTDLTMGFHASWSGFLSVPWVLSLVCQLRACLAKFSAESPRWAAITAWDFDDTPIYRTDYVHPHHRTKVYTILVSSAGDVAVLTNTSGD